MNLAEAMIRLRSVCDSGDLDAYSRWIPCGKCEFCQVVSVIEREIERLELGPRVFTGAQSPDAATAVRGKGGNSP